MEEAIMKKIREQNSELGTGSASLDGPFSSGETTRPFPYFLQ